MSAKLIAEGYDFAIYQADAEIEVRCRHNDTVLSTLTGDDAQDLKDCISSIHGGLLDGLSINEQAFDLLGATAAA